MRLLSSSIVQLESGFKKDMWIEDGARGAACWVRNGGNVGSGADIGSAAFGGTVVPMDPMWGHVRPVVGTGRGGLVHELLQAGVPEGVRLEFRWK